MRALIARGESQVLPRFFLGRLYDRLEMHEEAEKVLQGLAEPMDASPVYHYLLARSYQRRGQTERAMAAYRTCLERLGITDASFVCGSCGASYGEWQDRCAECGAWNSVDLDVRAGQLVPAEALIDRPVWGGYGPLDEPPAEKADDKLPVH